MPSYQYRAPLILACLFFLASCSGGAKKAREAEEMISASGQKQQESPTASGEKLLNMAEKDVVRLLGTPDFNRDEGPVRHIQYRNKICVVNVFLGKQKAGKKNKKERHVTHIDLRLYATKDASPITTSACWKELKRKRKKTKDGKKS